jgi:uncharacterized membrane protein YhaH (DUF805 family)
MVVDLWNRSVGRSGFIIGVAILVGLTIAFAKAVFDAIGASSIIGVLAGIAGIAVGLAVLSVPLAFLIRWRLRDLDLSGAFMLVAGPTTFLTMLMLYRLAASTSRGVSLDHLFFSASLWTSLLLVLALTVVAGNAAGGAPQGPIWQGLRAATDCEGRMSRTDFRVRASVLLASSIALNFALPVLMRHMTLSAQLRAVDIAAVANSVVLALLVSAAVRRLHDLRHTCLMAAFFPLGLSEVLSLSQTATTHTLYRTTAIHSLWTGWSLLWAIATVSVFLYLFLMPGDEAVDGDARSGLVTAR